MHGFAQLVVFYGLARAFHRTQQRGFVVAGWGAGFEGFRFNGHGLGFFAGLHGDEVLTLVTVFGIRRFFSGFFAVNGEPTGFDQYFSFCFEAVRRNSADACRHHVFRAGKEHSHEAAYHQVIHLLLSF